MASKSKNFGHSETVEHNLTTLREDYARIIGRPFENYFCPILLEDERVRLCMGHIINEACPNSFRGRVVQREDVDNFFGSSFEADFTGTVQAKSMSLREALDNPQMSKKLQPKLVLNGEQCEYYHDRGAASPRHAKIAVDIGEGEPQGQRILTHDSCGG
jgi:hypothetical protein